MGVITAVASASTVPEVIRELRSQTQTACPTMGLYFASARFQPDEISAQMQELFPAVPLFGCSTAGELAAGKMLKNSVVLMLFEKDVLEDVQIAVIERLTLDESVPAAFRQFEAHYQTPMADLDYRRYVGIILIDGLSGAEERIMEKIGDLTNVPFVGGSAADDLQFRATYVYAHGKAYAHAAALALIKPGVPFEILKTQSCRVLDQKLVATKVNEAARAVLEFNQRPAAEAYAEALGIPVARIAEEFFTHPVGLIINGEPFIRSPKMVGAQQSLAFYCQVKEGMELYLLETTDIVGDTAWLIADKQAAGGNFAALINFHCTFRTLQLERDHQTEAYGQIFADFPTIGFSTYGEAYIGHVNQTSTMLVFK